MWQSLPPLPSSAQGSTQAATRYEGTSAETKPPARRSKDRVEAKQKGRSSWRGLCELSPGRTLALALALRGSVSGCLCGLESMGDGNRFPVPGGIALYQYSSVPNVRRRTKAVLPLACVRSQRSDCFFLQVIEPHSGRGHRQEST